MGNKIINVGDGSMINWRYPIHPDMLKSSGMTIDSAIAGIKLKFTRKYIIGKLQHDLCLKPEKAIELLDEICSSA